MSGNEEKCINILLIGENFNLKTIFINAFANYLCFQEFKDAVNGKFVTLVATKFSVINAKCQTVTLSLYPNDGSQFYPKPQIFSFLADNKLKIQLIYTPNLNIPRNSAESDKNIKSTIKFLEDIDELNAIFVVLKPNSYKLDLFLEDSLKRLMLRLDKQCYGNVVFIVPSTSDERLLPILQRKIQDFRSILDIPIDIDNIFRFNYEPFKFLVAAARNVEVDKTEKDNMISCWKMASNICNLMVFHVVGDKMRPGLALFKTNEKSTKNYNASLQETLNSKLNLYKENKNLDQSNLLNKDGNLENNVKELNSTVRDLKNAIDQLQLANHKDNNRGSSNKSNQQRFDKQYAKPSENQSVYNQHNPPVQASNQAIQQPYLRATNPFYQRGNESMVHNQKPQVNNLQRQNNGQGSSGAVPKNYNNNISKQKNNNVDNKESDTKSAKPPSGSGVRFCRYCAEHHYFPSISNKCYLRLEKRARKRASKKDLCIIQ